MDNQIGAALMQVVAPVIITAIASLVTVLVNTITKVIVECRNYNAEQYKLMQKFYPEFKTFLIDIKFSLAEAAQNRIYNEANSMDAAIELILSYQEDEAEYNRLHPSHITDIVAFSEVMEDTWRSLAELSNFLKNAVIPATPIFHPFLKRKVHTMIATLQYFSLLIAQYQDDKISTDLLKAEIKDFPKTWKCEVNPALIMQYLATLDKWFQKF